MKAAVINIGTELLFGDTVNTNAAFLGKMLAQLEIYTMRMEVVGDNPERIAEALERNRKDHDLIIFTGGLGPTVDDITRETVFQSLNVESAPNVDVLMNIVNRVGIPMSTNNLSQMYVPSGAEIIPNRHGTAPGIFYNAGDVKILLLPGPPSELIPMCENLVIPLLKKHAKSTMVTQYLNVYGIGEAELESKLADVFKDQEKVKIGTYFDGEKVTLRLTASDVNRRRAFIAEVEAKIRRVLKDCMITVNNEKLEELLIQTLKESNIRAAVAESCTGGMLASKIIAVPGASEVFDSGVTAYSNAAKQKLLGVDPMALKNSGPVSPQVAHQMARGISLSTGAQLTCSVTGIAGPRGIGTGQKIGTVIIGIWCMGNFEYFEYHFNGSREQIRRKAATQALIHMTGKALWLMQKIEIGKIKK